MTIYGGDIMKKLFLLSLMLLAVCMFPVNAQAYSSTARVDGVECWHGDINYPVWSRGTGAGNIWDVSSAYLSENTANRIKISIISYDVCFERHMGQNNTSESMGGQQTMYLSENRQTGKTYYSFDVRKWNDTKKLFSVGYFDRAYRLVKGHLGLN